MKNLLVAACAMTTAISWAKPSKISPSPSDEPELYCKPGSQQGEVVYVNCQSRAPEAWIKFSMDYFAQETKFKITLQNGKFTLPKPDIAGNASLFIVDDPGLPPLLFAPESWWAVVNVACLATDDRKLFESRVKKELSRGFAFLCGGAESQFPDSLMSVANTAMLDKQEDHRLPIDVLDRFCDMMKNAGVTPAHYDEYLYACQEGWAPPPTNEAQKAIWDKVHAIPKNPIKIEFDPKKGR